MVFTRGWPASVRGGKRVVGGSLWSTEHIPHDCDLFVDTLTETELVLRIQSSDIYEMKPS